jgi:carbonic anhydrase
MRISSLFALLLAICALCAAQNTAPGSVPWSYQGRTGPLVWYKLDRSYAACNKGREQSPVEIRKARLDPALRPIEFHYIGESMTLINSGNTIEAQVDPGSYIVAGGIRYNLSRFEFHHPSEHAVGKKLFDMEVDLMHRSEDGKAANIAVLLSEDRGFPNAALAALWEHLPTVAGQSEKIADMVNPGGLLPGDRGYWTYVGSELTPPCTEGVRWFVMEQPISISRGQLNAFASLFRMNTRPTQELHGRQIQADE